MGHTGICFFVYLLICISAKFFFFKKSLKKKKKKEDEKIKKQNAFPCKFHKILKGSSFHCQKCADQIYL